MLDTLQFYVGIADGEPAHNNDRLHECHVVAVRVRRETRAIRLVVRSGLVFGADTIAIHTVIVIVSATVVVAIVAIVAIAAASARLDALATVAAAPLDSR